MAPPNGLMQRAVCVFAMKAFGGGNLTADYVKALDYVTGLPGVDSTMVGIVGAGGIGGALFAAFLRYEYSFVCTILATVIAIIVVGELVVNAVRKALDV